jgi:hypothetical protein
MVRHQGEIQALQMQELRIIRMQLESDRRTSQISTLIGFCLIIVAFMAHNGYLQLQPLQMVSFDTAIMLIVAMVLLVPRLLRKKL